MLWLLWFTFILLLLKMLARSSFIEYELHNLMRVLEHLNEVKTHQHDDSENIWKKAWLLISKAESMGILNKIECHLSLMWHFTDDKVSPFGGIPKKYPMTHKNGKEWTNVLDMHELLHTWKEQQSFLQLQDTSFRLPCYTGEKLRLITFKQC